MYWKLPEGLFQIRNSLVVLSSGRRAKPGGSSGQSRSGAIPEGVCAGALRLAYFGTSARPPRWGGRVLRSGFIGGFIMAVSAQGLRGFSPSSPGRRSPVRLRSGGWCGESFHYGVWGRCYQLRQPWGGVRMA
jgi:hypothetical protein